MPSSISLKAPAKINLYLEITGNRVDGYHDLVMVLQSIDLCDRLDLRLTGTDAIYVHCDHPEVPTDQTNLAYRAAYLLQQKYPDLGGVDITITKNIPVGAGLAGGSTDCAAVLVGLDRLGNLGLTQPELRELAAQLGSDIPFCIGGGTALAVGRGEILSPLPSLTDLALVICKPRNLGISTAWAYQTFRSQGLLASSIKDQNHSSQMLAAIASDHDSKYLRIARLMYNDLERVVLPTYPEIANLKQSLQDQECLGVLMSGSGSTVFAIAQNLDAAHRLAASINSENIDIWVTTSLINGIEEI